VTKTIPLRSFNLTIHRSGSRRAKVAKLGAVSALRWASKENGKQLNTLSGCFDEIRRSYAYRKWVKGRPHIKNLPGFACYRPSANSRVMNSQVASGLGPYPRAVETLISEIRTRGFDLPQGQIVFTGKAFSTPPHGRIPFRTFLSTSISPSVAASHARDHAHWNNGRAYVFVITLAIPAKALWGQFRSYREFELLFRPGAILEVHRLHRVDGGLYDVVEATLVGFS